MNHCYQHSRRYPSKSRSPTLVVTVLNQNWSECRLMHAEILWSSSRQLNTWSWQCTLLNLLFCSVFIYNVPQLYQKTCFSIILCNDNVSPRAKMSRKESWMTGHSDKYSIKLYDHVDIKGLFKWIPNSITPSFHDDTSNIKGDAKKCDPLGMIVRPSRLSHTCMHLIYQV